MQTGNEVVVPFNSEKVSLLLALNKVTSFNEVRELFWLDELRELPDDEAKIAFGLVKSKAVEMVTSFDDAKYMLTNITDSHDALIRALEVALHFDDVMWLLENSERSEFSELEDMLVDKAFSKISKFEDAERFFWHTSDHKLEEKAVDKMVALAEHRAQIYGFAEHVGDRHGSYIFHARKHIIRILQIIDNLPDSCPV